MTSRRLSPSSDAAHVVVPYKDGSSSKRGNTSKQRQSIPPTLSSSSSSFVGGGAVSRDERRRHAAAMSAAGGKGVSLVERDDRHAAEAIAAAAAALDQDGIGTSMNPNTDTHNLGSYSGQRAIFCIDQDCFYAQVIMRERPELRTRPLGITQKYLVVTCNYVARSLGVGKMCSITDALRQCPSLELVPGEDLTDFRAASDEIFHECQAFCRELMKGIERLDKNLKSNTNPAPTNQQKAQVDLEDEEEEDEDASSAHEDMLQRLDDARFGMGGTLAGLPPFLASQARSMARRANGGSGKGDSGGSVPAGAGVMLLERSGLDEIFFDCTAFCHFVVDLRAFMTNAGIVRAFTLEAESESSTTTNVTQHSPSGPSAGFSLLAQLLQTKPLEWKGHIVMGGAASNNSGSSFKTIDASTSPKSDQIFGVASAVCDALRRRLKNRLQFDTCGGVGGNKIVAKLAVNLHKPNDQTTVLPRAVLSLLRPLPMRMLYGVGRKVAKLLKTINVHTVEDYLNSSFDMASGSHGFASKLGLDKATIQFLDQACHGVDTRPVKPDPGFRRSFSVEDSMVDCNSIAKSHAYLHHLSRDFWTRIVEDSVAHFRVPTHMMLKARFSGFRRVSKSTELPQQAGRIVKMLVQHLPAESNRRGNPDNAAAEDTTLAAVASIEASAKRLLQECIHDFFAATGRKRGDTTKTMGPKGTLASASGFNITLLGIGTQQFQQLARPGTVGVPAFFKSSSHTKKSSNRSSTPQQLTHGSDDESFRKRPRMDPVSETLHGTENRTWTCSRCTFVNTQVLSKQVAKLKSSKRVSRHPLKRICAMCGFKTIVPDPNPKSHTHQTKGESAGHRKHHAEEALAMLAAKTPTGHPTEGHRLHTGSSQSALPTNTFAPLDRSRFVDLRQFIPDAEREQYGLPQGQLPGHC